ncbi:FGFR3 [Branchiostoma lanceolatum]|uniref:FGFR3 protein n=1 Tax=Branchiostoma lanceolatum TaxID=7740 RepID=A0A8K0F3N7_BRALA|nr:FGFR3 [Branchiostoma lanceolatum]
MQTFRAAVGVLVFLWVITAALTCPEKCKCEGREVKCHKRGLKHVPDNIPLETSKLRLDSNTIHNLSDVDFSRLTSLKRLDLDHNSISILSDGVFSDLISLEDLYLYNNNISVLPDGVFFNLTSLVQLYLNNNNIRVLSDGVFSNLISLVQLNLKNNNIRVLSDGVFSDLSSLEWLRLDNNSIRVLPDGVFSNLISLKMLYLDNNNISVLSDGVFSNLISLKTLYLHHNNISVLPDGVFSNLISLETLYLYNNDISVLSDGVFSNLITLVRIHLYNNNIRVLPDGVFSNLTSLEELYLYNNNISVLTDEVFSNLNRLKSLYLYNNNISVLFNGVFSKLISLEWLGLSNNNICVLPEEVFSNIMSLMWLDLNNNSISVFSDGVFSNLNSLVRLDLNSNKISVFSDGVFSNLTKVNVALGKTAIQSSTYSLVHNKAEKAVDGDRGNSNDHKCAKTELNDPQPWWKVDLADVYTVSRVSVLIKEERENFTVRVGPNENFIQNDQCGQTYTATLITGQIFLVHCDPPIPGRYVSVQMMGTEARLTLCEVEVYITETCCAEPSIDNGEVEGPYCYQQTVNVSCDDGYHLVGPKSMKCTEMGTWDNELTICEMEASALQPGIPPRPQFTGFEVHPARLKIGQKIGKGAFGVVSRAILQEEGKTKEVAVKTLTASAGDDDKLSFLQEIRAVADLGVHENLLGLIGCCTLVGDHLYLITEFMPYGDLKGFLGKCKEARKSETYYEPTNSVYNFEEKEVYKVSWQIAKGMNHISQADYVHGDLAARNVLVGDNLHVKISDFGLADHMYSRGYRRQDRLQRIPWKWMAPERLADGERYTTQSDVWSFGIVLYEIATLGGSPYPGMPTAGLVDQLKSGYRMYQPDDCPDPLYNLMLQCWSLDPEERPFFGKLAAVLDDLFSSHVDDYTDFISGSPIGLSTLRSERGKTWAAVGGTLNVVSIGASGVWGVTAAGLVKYRTGSYGNALGTGSDWETVEGNLVQITVGNGIVWGVNSADQIWIRTGISSASPKGTGWKQLTGGLRVVSCGGKSNYVWGVNYLNEVWMRTGIQTGNLGGTGWQKMDGVLKYVSVGQAGVWGVKLDNTVVYRTGTYGNPGSAGRGWTAVTSQYIKQVSVGMGVVWAVSLNSKIWLLQGITDGNPAGSGWKQIPGSLSAVYISSASNQVWGVGSGDQVFRRSGIGGGHAPSQRKTWAAVGGTLKFVSIGASGVWGVTAAGLVKYRTGSHGNALGMGSGWETVEGNLVQITVGNGIVWGVNSADQIWIRTGISSANPKAPVTNKKFSSADVLASFKCAFSAESISVGQAGVWGLKSDNTLRYRTGTYGNPGSAGRGWKVLTRQSVKKLTVGIGVIWAVSPDNKVWILQGMTSETPTGSGWKQIPGSLSAVYVSSASNQVWGVGSGDQAYMRSGIGGGDSGEGGVGGGGSVGGGGGVGAGGV